MSFFQMLRNNSKEAMIREEDKLDSVLFFGQQYVRSDEVFRLESNMMFQCVRPLSGVRIIKEKNSSSRYFMRRIENQKSKSWILKIIQNPVKGFLWPSDVVLIPEWGINGLSWLISYPLDSNDKMTKLSDFLEEQNILDLKKEEIDNLQVKRMDITKEILHIAKAFFIDVGLRYCNWRADHIYINKSGKMYVNFTDHIDFYKEKYPFDSRFHDWALYYSPWENNYSFDGDYFSLFILLFYVLVGRFPYDGRLMGELSFDTEAEQEYWNNEYRKRAIFIFDPDHDDNSIGTFAHERKHVDAWKNLSEDVRKLFILVFKKNNPMDADLAFNSLCKILINEE